MDSQVKISPFKEELERISDTCMVISREKSDGNELVLHLKRWEDADKHSSYWMNDGDENKKKKKKRRK